MILSNSPSSWIIIGLTTIKELPPPLTTGGDWSRDTVPPGAACRCIDGYFRDDESCARIRKCMYILEVYCNGQLQFLILYYKVHGICS